MWPIFEEKNCISSKTPWTRRSTSLYSVISCSLKHKIGSATKSWPHSQGLNEFSPVSWCHSSWMIGQVTAPIWTQEKLCGQTTKWSDTQDQTRTHWSPVQTWHEGETNYPRCLINSMPDRIAAHIAAKGSHMKYWSILWFIAIWFEARFMQFYEN